MKRIAILTATVALFASTATIALADDDAAEDAVEPDAAELVVHTEDPFEEQLWQVQLLARYRVGDEAEEPALTEAAQEIAELRTGEDKTGWGAIFKLLELEKLGTMTLEELLLDIGDDGWGFGWRLKEARENATELDESSDSPKNLGQLKKQDREENGTHGKKPKKP